MGVFVCLLQTRHIPPPTQQLGDSNPGMKRHLQEEFPSVSSDVDLTLGPGWRTFCHLQVVGESPCCTARLARAASQACGSAHIPWDMKTLEAFNAIHRGGKRRAILDPRRSCTHDLPQIPLQLLQLLAIPLFGKATKVHVRAGIKPQIHSP